MGLVTGLISALPELIQAAISLVQGIIDGLLTAIPQIISAALLLVQALCDGLVQNLPVLLTAAVDLILQLVNGLLANIPRIIDTALQIVMALQGLIQVVRKFLDSYHNNNNSRTVNQTNNSPKSLSRLEIYRMTRNALKGEF